MYTNFFGLHEIPFTAGTNSKYFFPANSHAETLLYLKYSVSQGEGFTLITGEKGIGKTTVCRTFIERQDEQVKAAFISYSNQNSMELMKTIIRAYGIKVSRYTLKDLTDGFNNFLMHQKTAGKRVIVFLDDAHKHNKDLLEQLRLLSNLETTRDKLLQIVLIGRPELSDMLNSHELRPLGQRMAVSYQLQPLNDHETNQYINHRIGIAGQGASIRFDPSAIKQIYNYSSGIPYLINSVCNKALITAYRLGQRQISGEILKAVLKDLQIKPTSIFDSDPFYSISKVKFIGLSSILILLLCLLAVNLFQGNAPENKPEIFKIKPPEKPYTSRVQKSQQFEVDNNSRNESAINKIDSHRKILNPNTDMKISQESALNKQNYYSIQVGAFLVLKNAQAKMDRLTQKGYAARIINFEDRQGRNWHTVRIGNYPSSELAKEEADILISEHKLEAIVLPANKF